MSADVTKTPDESRTALMAAVGCYTLWGFLPLYFHALALQGVGPWEMIAHRTLWAAPWAFLAVLLARQAGQVAAVLRQPRTLLILACSTAAIFINWSIYVLAVNAGHVIEASLGYYINPLMTMAAGAVLFRERISREGAIAIGLAAIGVAIQTAALGHLPLVALGLALSFCLYGILRKQVKADAQTGLFIECAYLAVPGLIYVLHLQSTGAGHFGAGTGVSALLLLAGPVTVVPLALFAWSARRMPLSAMGFLQFIGPTLQFGIGIALGEAFTPLRALSFLFIWAGVVVFAYGAWKRTRTVAQAV
ncbi:MULTISPECIES: EamA family transporter RarD [unclassified Caulobacter]|uniref:EamA family transporter RarD n=1 Tax=unclassified Caulobacter TaxID=2648921 RepID=UPI000D3AB615|nr:MULTISPECIES: EamA family transporter RarD [unclassified Caulobacter]PTS91610.1 EamA family transporter RarD [Caulobacter sp. HMWF009]PTT10747.1 EamA family transporter RarD [Caulobacter sp. HMWF025]